jgi:hypothetical protein
MFKQCHQWEGVRIEYTCSIVALSKDPEYPVIFPNCHFLLIPAILESSRRERRRRWRFVAHICKLLAVIVCKRRRRIYLVGLEFLGGDLRLEEDNVVVCDYRASLDSDSTGV